MKHNMNLRIKTAAEADTTGILYVRNQIYPVVSVPASPFFTASAPDLPMLAALEYPAGFP